MTEVWDELYEHSSRLHALTKRVSDLEEGRALLVERSHDQFRLGNAHSKERELKSSSNSDFASVKENLQRILELALEEPQTKHTQRGIATICGALLYDMRLGSAKGIQASIHVIMDFVDSLGEFRTAQAEEAADCLSDHLGDAAFWSGQLIKFLEQEVDGE